MLLNTELKKTFNHYLTKKEPHLDHCSNFISEVSCVMQSEISHGTVCDAPSSQNYGFR